MGTESLKGVIASLSPFCEKKGRWHYICGNNIGYSNSEAFCCLSLQITIALPSREMNSTIKILRALKKAKKLHNYILGEISPLIRNSEKTHLQILWSLLKKAKESNDQALEALEQILASNKPRAKTRLSQSSPTLSVTRHLGESASAYHPKTFSTAQRLLQNYNAVAKSSPPNRFVPLQPKDSAPQQLCRDYNAGIGNSGRKNEFIQRYQPIRVSVVNAMARRRDATIKADFQTANDGDYYAVEIKGETLFAVALCPVLA